MAGFTKLFSSLVLSTVWREPNHIRIVWVTMLALAESDGYVGASVPGLADAARVTISECEEALASFLAPDPYSRSKEHQGRRIEEAERGWRLLNYERFRNSRDEDERREQNRLAQARARQRKLADSQQSQQSQPASAQAEAEAEAEAERDGEHSAAPVPAQPKRRSSKAGSSKPKRWKKVPPDWEPTDEHRRIAAEEGRDFTAELRKFRNWDYERPKSDADASFRKWLRSDIGRNNSGSRKGPVAQRGLAAGVTMNGSKPAWLKDGAE